MYEDARFIFREYIQNSADQIDKAAETGLFNDLREGRIEIDINLHDRSISIYDNATGIQSAKVASTLKDIAQSKKDRTKSKGFRGIGRLGGLAYCDKLIFETSYQGEPTKSRLIWDAKHLKSIINNRSEKEEATAVIDEVTTFQEEGEDRNAHYFTVTLEGVSNEQLLDKESVYLYLSMVSPVPYNKGFIYKGKIYDKAKELNYPIDEYSIFLNKDQIFKRYTTSIYQGEPGNKSKIDEIYDVEFFEIKNREDLLLAWGWHSISKLEKVMPAINLARSIRLRKGNIQIGLEDAMVKLFKEPRGTKYFFGEIHCISPDLIPNARRDYFLETDTLKAFEKMARSKFDELYKLYHFSSKVRSETRKIDALTAFTQEYEKKAQTGFRDFDEEESYREELETRKEKAKEAKQKLEKVQEQVDTMSSAQKKVFEKIVGKTEPTIDTTPIPESNGKPKFITDDISRLSRKEKKLVSRIFGVIGKVLTQELGDNLIEKIKEELQ
ncbi:MAG: ATP-binding protein [Bacteroidota bacterium]